MLNFKVRKIAVVLMVVLIMTGLPMKNHAETVINQLGSATVLTQSTDKLPSLIESSDKDVLYWILKEGIIQWDQNSKLLLFVNAEGLGIKLYANPIDNLWQSGGRLYLYDGKAGKVFELDTSTKTIKETGNLRIKSIDEAIDSEALKPFVKDPVLDFEIYDNKVFYNLQMSPNELLVAPIIGETPIRVRLPWSLKRMDIQQGLILLLNEKGEIFTLPLDGLFSESDVKETSLTLVNPLVKIDESVEPKLPEYYKPPVSPSEVEKTTDPSTVKPVKPTTPETTLKEIEQAENKESKPILNDPLVYTDVKGVLTFRGDHQRQNGAYGVAKNVKVGALTLNWKQLLPATSAAWGGGAGWTGQPLLVQWPRSTKTFMNISQHYKNNDQFVEVIQASLNGNVYFFDLSTGNPTRPAIKIGNPIKGTPSIDSRGYPLLYVGDGIDQNKQPGFRIFNLINQQQLYYQTAKDVAAPRNWPGFDSSALFLRDKDQMIVAGENGVFYQLTLNAKFNTKTGKMTIMPVKKVFSSKMAKGIKGTKEGTENSIARYKDLFYYSDNSGVLRCVNSNLKLVWSLANYDDTDSSTGLEIENGKPVLYTASEVDSQGALGLCRILKVDGLTGKVLWKKSYTCHSRFGASPSNGGALASPVVGKNDIGNVVIYTLSRCETFTQGSIVALDKATGKEVWRHNMKTYAWPSPVAIYDEKGKSYLVQNDHSGYVRVFEGKTGKEIWSQKVDSYLEASPAVFDNKIVFSSRTGKIYCFTLY